MFTPKGDIKKLPKGASALDFAYAVHSDIGNHCIGAKIGNEAIPLHHVLNNGDHIEVLTARSACPTPLWLHYVVTGKARASIRNYLKSQQEGDAAKLGRQLLDQALTSVGLTTRLKTSQKIGLLKRLDREDWNELLADIGLGKRLPMMVARQLLPDSGAPSKKTKSGPLPIKGVEGGECVLWPMLPAHSRRQDNGPVFRWPWHCYSHHNLSLMLLNRRKASRTGSAYSGRMKLRGNLRQTYDWKCSTAAGVLAQLAALVAEEGSNINSVAVNARDNRNSTIRFTIEVANRQHLAQIIRRLRARRSVIRVFRARG
ncbi:MAG: hypothetical protein Ct9H300mP14_00220 [Gammaproteobacteria bacterium]|nr:MAG: hypothetical protein Ct9H300mP14_00220 [Gammaproteobacteria bacterium]